MFMGPKIQAAHENRNVSPFNGVSLKISAELYITQGEKQFVNIDADASTLENLIAEVKNHILIIRSTKNNFFSAREQNKNIKIYITCPDIFSLTVMGNGNIFNKSQISSRILDLKIMGSGNIVISGLNSESVKGTIMGSGKISLASRKMANEFKLYISGAGYYKGAEYPVKKADVKISGSGNAIVNATDDLDVHISGSGKVFYTGNPNLTTAVSGSGKVKELKTKDEDYEINSMRPIKRQ